MAQKSKKAQVVLAAIDSQSQNFSFLLFQTNEKRGSFWQNVTGKLDEGETFEEGALREAIEESQLKTEHIVDIISLGLTFEFVDQRKRQVTEKTFLIVLDEKWEVHIDPHEHQDFKWISMDEIHPEIVKYSSNYETLLKAQKVLKHRGFE